MTKEKKEIQARVESSVPIRTYYQPGTFRHIETGGGKDVTDTSGYIPIKDQIESMTRGVWPQDIPIQYESSSTGDEDTLFAMQEATEAMMSELNNEGEAALKAKLTKIQKDISSAIAEAKKVKPAAPSAEGDPAQTEKQAKPAAKV